MKRLFNARLSNNPMALPLFTLVVLCASFVLGGCLARSKASSDIASPARGVFVPVPGGRLHLVDLPSTGSARGTVVLVHGASSNHAHLLATLGPGLRSRFRVIAVDRPGQGLSERLGGRDMAEPDAQARAIAAALDKMKTGPVILVAHSLAGALATNMALERPDLVQALVLLAPVTHPWPGGIAWYYGPTTTPLLGPVFTRAIAVPAASGLLEEAARDVFAPAQPPANYIEVGQVRQILEPSRFESNAQDVSALKAFVSRQAPRYPALSQPAVVITGDTDQIVSPDIHARAFAREAPNARLIVINGGGHMPYHTGRERVLAEIRRLGRN